MNFSLRQIFFAIVAISAGLSIWRLPEGNWLDLPLTVLGIYFIRGLVLRARDLIRHFKQQSHLPRDLQWGYRFLVVQLLAVAAALLIALALRYLAAGKWLLVQPEDFLAVSLSIADLPQDLTLFALLISVCLGAREQTFAAPSNSQRVLGMLAILCMISIILARWIDQTFITYVMYLAISSIEAAKPAIYWPDEMQVDATLRIDRFLQDGSIMLMVAVGNLLLFSGILTSWYRVRMRTPLLLVFAAGCLTQLGLVITFVTNGIRRFSLPFHEAQAMPEIAAIIVVVCLIMLAAGAFAWRISRTSNSLHAASSKSQLYLHEKWQGCLLVGLLGLGRFLTVLGSAGIAWLKWRLFAEPLDTFAMAVLRNWHEFAFAGLGSTTGILWTAAAIAGFTLAWRGWRRRNNSSDFLVAGVDSSLYGFTFVGSIFLALTSAPVVAVSGICYWLLFGAA